MVEGRGKDAGREVFEPMLGRNAGLPLRVAKTFPCLEQTDEPFLTIVIAEEELHHEGRGPKHTTLATREIPIPPRPLGLDGEDEQAEVVVSCSGDYVPVFEVTFRGKTTQFDLDKLPRR